MNGYHVYFDTPPVVFKARVNMASVSYPVTHLQYDGVTVGAFGDIIPDMTLVLGTTDGADDLGRVRVQNVADATLIAIGRISQGVEDGTLDIEDNAYITIYDDYRVWSKIPRMILDDDPDTPDVDTFKDSDIPVLSYNDEIPPKANAGPFFADYIDPDTGVITVQFPKNGVDVSYAVAEGATITDYLWDVVDGTITVGSATSAVITATFPAGRRWVGLTVTDSNGKVQTSRTFVLAVDPDDDVTYQHVSSLDFTLEQDGGKVALGLNTDLPRSTYMDGCLVLVWKDGAASPGSRSHMKLCGWLQSEEWKVGASKKGLTRGTTLQCVDIGGRLKELPGFPQALERSEESGWEYMPDLTINRALNYLGAWHTTAWSLADVILPVDGDDYPAMRLDTNGGNIFEQLSSTAKKIVPTHILTCTPDGQLIFTKDWMEDDVDDRPEATQQIMEDDIQEIGTTYTRQPRVHVLTKGAIQASTDWVLEDGKETLPLVFSKAPGDVFSQGTSDLLESEGIAIDQDSLNRVTGHRYARHNARFAPFPITLANLSLTWSLAPAYMDRVQLDIPAVYAAQRGLPFTSAYGQVKSMTIRVSADKKGTKTDVSLNWELEVSGKPGITHIPEETGEGDDNTPDPGFPDLPPLLPGGSDLLAGIGLDGHVYRTFDFTEATPTWDEVDLGISGTIYSWVVDPFSPGYIQGTGYINGWIVNDTDIYRVTDIFGDPTATSVYTFATATVGASFHWRSIQASFGRFFDEGNPWLMVVSYYKNTSGKEGTWCVHSEDAGATWSEEAQITAHYDSTVQTRFRPIGLYLSPKTPGRALTAAYLETGAAAEAQGYLSEDYGETWSAYPDIQTGTGLAGTIHVPWDDNSDEGVILHGLLSTGDVEGTDEELLPRFGKWPDSGSLTVTDPTISATMQAFAQEVGSTLGLDEDGFNLIIAPPPTTKRMVVQGVWSYTKIVQGGSSGATASMATQDGTGTTRSGDDGFSPSSSSGGFTIEWSFTGGDWPVNNVSIVSSPPGTPNNGCRFDVYCNANAVGVSNEARSDLTLTVTVTEIELDNGTIYYPTLPSSTRAYRTIKVQGGVIADISPTDEDRSYGVNRGHFSLRAYDSDRQFILASVVGNDTSDDADDDMHALYLSTDSGATYEEVIAPIADASAPTNRAALEAAFSGTSADIFYIWGMTAYMKYSDDGGASLQDKEGNLSALSAAAFIGICGGPTDE